MSDKLIGLECYVISACFAPTPPRLFIYFFFLLTPSHFSVYMSPQMASGAMMSWIITHPLGWAITRISVSLVILVLHDHKNKVIKVKSLWCSISRWGGRCCVCAFLKRLWNAAPPHPVESPVGSGFHRMRAWLGCVSAPCSAVCQHPPVSGAQRDAARPDSWSHETDEFLLWCVKNSHTIASYNAM